MSAGPALVVGVAGTGTDVGKTWTASSLARSLRARGLLVSARKPAQSFAPGTPEEETDAFVLARSTGEAPTDICLPQRWYGRAMAPPMAAASMGLTVPTLADLVAELRWPATAEVGLLELAGGVASPLAADGDGADLLARAGAGLVVLVAGAGLGTLNDVRLCARAVAPGTPLSVFLNRFDDGDELHRANRHWLAVTEGLRVTTSVEALAGEVFSAYTGAQERPRRAPG